MEARRRAVKAEGAEHEKMNGKKSLDSAATWKTIL
jgi:hypothetical protein